ncbi:MAG TPA: dihydrodipicolinate synthase family protein [Pseudorhodoplanes sp.]|jgi:dihydrodipicolinate synthase/N-acetylneuraminate lyase|nr:dihydrodipicolinate synthase family protein [Pseudorhodoplanes sp.]
MKTGPVTPSDLQASVLSVPPLARRADLTIDRDQNARLLSHLRSGGVRTFMYGGNANLYNIGVSEFGSLLDLLQDLAQDNDWMIPSVGSDFGKAMDQVAIAREYPFPTVMVLPHRFPATPAGIATGYRKLADAYGRPIIAYVKDAGFIEARDLHRLANDGVICAIKYAIVRPDNAPDPFLEEVLAGVDKSIVISGIGERPAIHHLTNFGLSCFTSGSVCVAPRLSMALLQALRRNNVGEAEGIRAKFIPLEDLRDGHSPLRVLHEAVRLAGICDTGPIQPFLSNITEASVVAQIERAAKDLLAANNAAMARAA